MTDLPPLSPLTSIARPLSLSEYYHACVATSLFTLEKPREIVLVLRGRGFAGALDWQSAIDQVARVHPGTRLRMVGSRTGARWRSDGLPPRLRLIQGEHWDACSNQGAGFITEKRLSLRRGPTIELIVSQGEGDRLKVLLRARHAVIDGRGGMLILAELFRALRGESLHGCNAAFTDFDFRRSVGKIPFGQKIQSAHWPACGGDANQKGDMFRRISLGNPKPGMMAHIAIAMARFVHRHSDDPVLLGLPVDLRRHIRGLLTTANFTDMMRMRIDKGDGVEAFAHQLQERLAHLAKAGYPDIPDKLKLLPLPWLDLLVSRTRWGYRKRKPSTTATLSNLGRIDAASYTAPGFMPEDFAMLPIPGDVFVTLACLGDQVEMMIGMPKLLADDESLHEFESCIRQELA